ncbi:hypothetical protein CC1G_10097 [Coprinopsis cinerea okayama7|uniref:Uncharacterized protein n=1 Tax=Coprinopsis cinerea (strain Okayama-7 / 130 / ATCC MYA-4618 / FGSC 9003) TaxID=240176 RepID=A8N3X2_COPC7|nr:hypothetical protein CC1G_10097 [Coprinopsis cinerea okayama7\|eukprot:XP_001829567.1 hypothetical protein CC1G_10097 [Coprinopsis cinerea okayama7\
MTRLSVLFTLFFAIVFVAAAPAPSKLGIDDVLEREDAKWLRVDLSDDDY